MKIKTTLLLALILTSPALADDVQDQADINQILADAKEEEVNALPESAFISRPELQAALARSVAYNPKKAEEERIEKATAFYKTKTNAELRQMYKKAYGKKF